MPDSMTDSSVVVPLSDAMATIHEYLVHRRGHVVALSTGSELAAYMGRLFDSLALCAADGVTLLDDPVHALAVLEQRQSAGKRPILLVEHLMNGHDLRFMVCQFREAYPELRMIALTSDLSRERVMLLHEMGADQCLAIPLDSGTLTGCIANMVRPESRDVRLAQEVRALLRAGDVAQAYTVCQKLLKLKTDGALAHVLLGDVLRKMNKPDEARAAYEEAACHTDVFLTPLKRLAAMALEAGQLETRLLFLYRMDELSPFNVERKMEMGAIHLQLGQSLEAERLFEKALHLADREASLRIVGVSEHIADLYYNVDIIKAEQYWRQSLAGRPGPRSEELVYALNRLGLVLRSQGRWQEALAEYRRAAELSPDDDILYYNMGMACLEGNDVQAAARHMSKALVLNPRLPYSEDSVAFNMGMVFLKSNDTARGLHCMKMAIEQNPDCAEAREALASYGAVSGEGYE